MAPAPRNGNFRVDGVDRFLHLARNLEAAGRGDLVKELKKGLQQGAKQLTPESRKQALAILPKRGGLNKLVATAPQRVTARVGNTTASVTIRVGKKGSGARGAELGVIRHPVFFHPPMRTRRFVAQFVRPHWFTIAARTKQEDVGLEIKRVLDDFTQRIVNGV